MTITVEELKERLAKHDEVELLEILHIYSDEIVERFTDRIEDQYDTLVAEEEEDDSES